MGRGPDSLHLILSSQLSNNKFDLNLNKRGLTGNRSILCFPLEKKSKSSTEAGNIYIKRSVLYHNTSHLWILVLRCRQRLGIFSLEKHVCFSCFKSSFLQCKCRLHFTDLFSWQAAAEMCEAKDAQFNNFNKLLYMLYICAVCLFEGNVE